jgi:DNA polymerase
LLRLPDEARGDAYAGFVDDLRRAAALAAEPVPSAAPV